MLTGCSDADKELTVDSSTADSSTDGTSADEDTTLGGPGGGADTGLGPSINDDKDYESLDIGHGLVFEKLDYLVVKYGESIAEICEMSTKAYIVVGDQNTTSPQLQVIAYMVEGVDGEYRVGEDLQVALVEESTHLATTGEVVIALDDSKLSATIELNNITFESYEDEGVVYSGSVTLDIIVSCLALQGAPSGTEDGDVGSDDCSWDVDSPPSTEYCLEVTSDYPADVLY